MIRSPQLVDILKQINKIYSSTHTLEVIQYKLCNLMEIISYANKLIHYHKPEDNHFCKRPKLYRIIDDLSDFTIITIILLKSVQILIFIKFKNTLFHNLLNI